MDYKREIERLESILAAVRYAIGYAQSGYEAAQRVTDGGLVHMALLSADGRLAEVAGMCLDRIAQLKGRDATAHDGPGRDGFPGESAEEGCDLGAYGPCKAKTHGM